jgi:hypothetical protein
LNPNRLVVSLFFSLVFVVFANGKEAPLQVIDWPASGPTVVRFSFSKFKELSSVGKQHLYTTDVTAENLWNKKISRAEFTLYVFDKAKVRIGEGFVSVSDVSPAGVVKFQTTIPASGTISSMELVPQTLPPELQPALPPKVISITVNSVPQGADVKLDGIPEGFTPGTFPLEITQNDVSGGSVSYELGMAAHDTLELRDGSVLSGDVQSMTATEVFVRIGGTIQNINRNQVKRIILIQRDQPSQ